MFSKKEKQKNVWNNIFKILKVIKAMITKKWKQSSIYHWLSLFPEQDYQSEEWKRESNQNTVGFKNSEIFGPLVNLFRQQT